MWNPESYELKKDRMMQNAKNKKINPDLSPFKRDVIKEKMTLHLQMPSQVTMHRQGS